MKTPYIVGPPVRQPADFFGRASQTRQFFDTLDGVQVQCVSILGLRRAGKTSFLQHIAHPKVMVDYLPEPSQYLMLYLDLSACHSAADFYGRVCKRLLEAMSSRAAVPEPADVYAVESLLYAMDDRRVVILMDEFDQLRTAQFSSEFMTELRALASVWDYELAYVTASYWDLYRLGNYVGLPPTSPFYNIFFPTPIYLSGLNPSDLDALIRVPARRVGIEANDEDIAFIRHIAGSLPYFLQATAAVWLPYKAKASRRLPEPGEIIPRLVSEMAPYYEQWWQGFSDVERAVLSAVAQERPVERLPYDDREMSDTIQRLQHYGLIMATGKRLWTDSMLLNHWLLEFAAKRAAR